MRLMAAAADRSPSSRNSQLTTTRWKHLSDLFHPSLLSLFLAAAPKLKPMTVPTRVDEGSRLTVKCEATGNPVPTYRWFKDGDELKKSKKVRIKSGQ